MNSERLERMAILLEAYTDSRETVRFDLQDWGAMENKRRGFLWVRQETCRTAACAIGLACGSGIFATDGLSYSTGNTGAITPIFGDFEGWAAVGALFDLDRVQTSQLFGAHSYDVTEGEIAARHVATRIRDAIKHATPPT